jgi:hypothetical protein
MLCRRLDMHWILELPPCERVALGRKRQRNKIRKQQKPHHHFCQKMRNCEGPRKDMSHSHIAYAFVPSANKAMPPVLSGVVNVNRGEEESQVWAIFSAILC